MLLGPRPLPLTNPCCGQDRTAGRSSRASPMCAALPPTVTPTPPTGSRCALPDALPSPPGSCHPHPLLYTRVQDVLGTGSVVAFVVATFAKPYIKGAPILSCAILAVVAIVVQLTLFDLVLVPEISKVWQHVEANGTALGAPRTSLVGPHTASTHALRVRRLRPADDWGSHHGPRIVAERCARPHATDQPSSPAPSLSPPPSCSSVAQ